MSRKLIVRLKGGLGNQLFCYASARRLAHVNDAELVLDDETGFKYDYLYNRMFALSDFKIPARCATSAELMEPFGRVRRLIARKASERKPLGQRRYIQQVGVEFDSEILSLRLRDGETYFDAFGQSEWYFDDIREIIKQDLEMLPPKDQANQVLADEIDASVAVALHVRWFDTGQEPHSSNMSFAYYEKAITRLLARIDQPRFFIFSDKPKETDALLAPLLQGHACTVVDHNALLQNANADFWLMRRCRHFIIGNSTFAWWAAWLGERADGSTMIVAPSCNVDPKHSVTAWGFNGLLPERWTVI